MGERGHPGPPGPPGEQGLPGAAGKEGAKVCANTMLKRCCGIRMPKNSSVISLVSCFFFSSMAYLKCAPCLHFSFMVEDRCTYQCVQKSQLHSIYADESKINHKVDYKLDLLPCISLPKEIRIHRQGIFLEDGLNKAVRRQE